MRRRSEIRGGALASTLLIVLFLAVFALTLANLATFDLRTVTRNGQRQMAFEAAQAGLDAVTAEIAKDPTLGKSSEVLTATLSDGSSYRVTFDASETGPFSANNLDSLSPETIGYKGRSVPALHASLLSVGTAPNGETSVVESLIRLEAIPYAVAGTGEVELNSTVVAGLEEAHVYSGKDAANSLRLGGLATVIRGDARSAGGISQGVAIVEGDVEENVDPEHLPRLDIATFDNHATATYTHSPPFLTDIVMLPGTHYVDAGGGTAVFPALTLTDATLYVDGNLEITTALAGTGTIFVNGSTNFPIGITLSGTDRLTLFSEDDISFGLASIFQGVLYTHGNVRSLGVLEVLGAVYAVNDSDPNKGNIEIGTLLLPSMVTYLNDSTAFASYWLAQGGEANPIQVYWRRLR